MDYTQRPLTAILQPCLLDSLFRQCVDPSPMSAYFLWLQASRSKLKADHPELKSKELLKKAGEVWGALEGEEKEKWDAAAAEAKAKYAEAKAAYEASQGESTGSAESMAVESATAAV